MIVFRIMGFFLLLGLYFPSFASEPKTFTTPLFTESTDLLSPSETSKKTVVNHILFDQLPALIKRNPDPKLSMLLLASMVPVSQLLPKFSEEVNNLSLIVNFDLADQRRSALLGVEYVF